MPSKQQYNKAAWDWASTLDSDVVTEDHIHTAYRIKLKPCKLNACRRNCKGNPHCLNGLGEKSWLQDIADEDWHEIDDPNAERREKNCFVGLKNLGATCYVNSFLQVWYHNPAFRKAVYEWQPKDDPQESANVSIADEFSPVSCIGHLQFIFALLQFSCRKYIDPTPFINSLGLCTTQQQDAQEFCKLFISLLEEKFSHQSNPAVRSIVQQQYSGEYAYVTRCHKCQTESERPSEFYELDLNIKGHKDLYESLEEFMQEEKLEGSNQYSCSHCKQNQDATRCIRLLRLPPTLHLQLLRFVFDRQSGSKKKLNSFIRFPEVLDMSKYLQKPENSVVYHLSAVLIHCGPSAYSGHYVAHIHDRASGSWYKFNDETVEKMEGKKLQLGSEEDLSDDISVKPSSRAPKVAKGYHASNNAYMMVYRLRSEDQNEIPSEWTLPEHLRKSVTTDNAKFEEWVDELAVMREQNVVTGKARQVEIRTLYDKLAISNGGEVDAPSFEWISTSWLSKWLASDLANVPEVNNTKALCPHEKLDPCAVDTMKCINSAAGDIIYEKYGGGPRFRNTSLCRCCVESKCRLIRTKAKLLQDQKNVTSLLKAKITDGEKCYWIGKVSLRNWRQMVLREFKVLVEAHGNDGHPADDEATSQNEEGTNGKEAEGTIQGGIGDDVGTEDTDHLSFNEDVLCDHNNLQVEEGSRKLIPAEAWELLKHYFPLSPEFESGTSEPCGLCRVQQREDLMHKDFLRCVAQDQKTSLLDLYNDRNRPSPQTATAPPGVFFLLNRSFVEQWRRFVREPGRRDSVKDVNNSSLLCCHNLLKYSPDPSFDKDLRASVVLVWEDEWKAISKMFCVDVEVQATVSDGRDGNSPKLYTTPGVCEVCYGERLEQEHLRMMDFNNAKIYVRRVSKLDEEGDASSQATSSGRESDDPEFTQSLKKRKMVVADDSTTTDSAADIRRSSRRRKMRGEKELTVSGNQTLRDLKVQIMKHFSVAPYDQHLSLCGQRLTDSQASLASLNILPGSLILLQADEVAEEAIVMEDYMKASTPETGFKGTELQKC